MASSTTPGSAAFRALPHALGPALRLWLVDLDAYADQCGPAWHASLSEEERQRAARMASSLLQRRSLARRHALRHLLGEALACSPQDLLIEADRFGKPSLRGLPLHFSLSHREQHALVGVHTAAALGVDLELLRPIADLDSLAEACLSDEERTVWAGVAPAERLAEFLRCWTRKEACLKALGVGLSAPLRQIDVGGRVGDGPVVLPLHADSSADMQANGSTRDMVTLQVHSVPVEVGPGGLLAACAWADSDAVARAHAAWG